MMQVMTAVTDTKTNPIDRRSMEISAFTGRRYQPGLPPIAIFLPRWWSVGVSEKSIVITGNRERRAWLAEKSGQSTVPQIFIHGKGVGGFTELEALDEAGGLDPLVKSDLKTG